MNGSHIKQAAIQKAKQVASAGNGNANKKRKKELKPIITTDGPPGQDAESASNMASSNQAAAAASAG
jgi:serine/threonine-protein kinase SRPK3